MVTVDQVHCLLERKRTGVISYVGGKESIKECRWMGGCVWMGSVPFFKKYIKAFQGVHAKLWIFSEANNHVCDN